MKVVCEYCGSYVEADENMKCPLCQAELGSSVRVEQERIDREEDEEAEREAQEKAQEAKDSHISEIIQGVTSVATAIASGASSIGASISSSKENRPPEPPDVRRVHPRQMQPHGDRDGFSRHGAPHASGTKSNAPHHGGPGIRR